VLSPRCRSRWLQCRNALRRYPALWPSLILLAAAGAAIARSRAAQGLFRAGAAHPLLSAACVALACAVLTSRGRRRAEQRWSRSWLAALPLSHSLPAASARVPLTGLGALTAAIALAVSAGLAPSAAMRLLLAVAAGGATGLTIGWFLPHTPRPATPASRYAVLRRPRRAELRGSLWGLGHWAIARSQVWGRPKITARQVCLAALAVPLDASAAQGLAIVATTLIAAYLVRLSTAVIPTAFQAARWLAPTPLGATRFTSAVLWVAVLRQLLVITGVLAGGSALFPALTRPHPAAWAAGWMGISSVVGVAGCALAYLAGAPERAGFIRRGWSTRR